MLNNYQNKKLSNSNFGITANNIEDISINEVLNKKFNKFIKAMNLNASFMKELEYENIFSDIDFKTIIPDENSKSFINQFMYPHIFNDLKHIDSKPKYKNLQHIIKYAFTIDHDLTKKSIKIDGEELHYGEMLLGKTPIVYFIGISSQEIIWHIKNIRETKTNTF